MTDRFIPANETTEQAVLGSLLIDNSKIRRIAAMLHADDFYQQKNAWIYEAILSLNADGKAADFLTVCDIMEQQGQIKEVGGSAYILDLLNAVPTSVHVEYYAQIVVRLSADRAALRLASQIVQVASEGQGKGLNAAAELLQDAKRKHYSASSNGPKPLDDVIEEMLANAAIMRQRRKDGTLIDIQLPWMGLARAIKGGLLGGDVVLVVGEPSVGKSTLVHMILDHATQFNHGALILTTETSRGAFAARQLAPRAGLDSRLIRSGNLNDDDWQRVQEMKELVKRPTMFIDDTTYDAAQIELRIQQTQSALADRGTTLDIVVFDYLQLFRDSRHNYDDHRKVAGIISLIREMAVMYNFTAIVVSELSRDEYKNKNKPSIFGSKESGRIEYATTIGLAMYRNPENKKQIIVDIQKNKDGPKAEVVLPPFNKNYAWIGNGKLYTVLRDEKPKF